MSLAASQTQLTNSSSRTHLCFYATRIPPKTLIFTLPISARHGGIPIHFEILGHRASTQDLKSSKNLRWPLRVFESEGTVQREGLDKFNLDDFLSIAELLCLVPSVVLSIGCAVNWVFSSSQKSLQVSLVSRFFVWQFVLLVGAVVFGSLIRRRHWRRICRDSIKSGGSSFDLVERIEKLEEDLRSSVTIIRVLSRQLEKLGIRFRVTRKTLKEPITETAALAKKNSEATRALAIQEDILERELGEIQKALLAMQEQQQKQLQLILAIGKAGKLRENIRESVAKEEMIGQINSAIENEGVKQMETQTQTQTGARHKGSNNDKASV